MSRKKALTSYPREYFTLFRTASHTPITITHESHTQAEATRNELYTFRQVLYDEGDVSLEALKTAAQNVRLTITGSTLTCEPIREKKDESTE